MYRYYPVDSRDSLINYLSLYLPLVVWQANKLQINLTSENLSADHIGVQVLSNEEFDIVHEMILTYSDLTSDKIIHDRRNRVYAFNEPVQVGVFKFASIETFEPKPEAELSKLKPGVEHVAFTVAEYERFIEVCKANNMPIDKSVELNGSKFIKTKLVNLVEIEFRSDHL